MGDCPIKAQGASFEERLRAYATLVVRKGCNLQNGQRLFIQASVECAPFVRLLVEEAYRSGAKHVTVAYGDERVARLHYDNCDLALFETVPEWLALRNNWLAQEGAAMLSITSEDPLAMTGIDPAKPMAAARAAHTACKEYFDALDKGRCVWCIVAAASPAWAERVFAHLGPQEALASLWDAIFACVRVGEGAGAGAEKGAGAHDAKDATTGSVSARVATDALDAWDRHRRAFEEHKAWLNRERFTALRYRNSLGTDLTVGLNSRGIWQGGGDVTIDGVAFFPNMPTEEVFTTPDFTQADGVAVASLPLVHNGSLITGFSLRFEGGRVVSSTADQGGEMLEALIGADEGSCRLGEVALVPHGSPIARSGILFYNTLFDENAACHLALGKGFSDCVQDGQSLDQEGLKAAGVNESAIHVDFMIGTPDLEIIGIHADGTEVPVFKDGGWAAHT
ncbi:MAG: aminopeptidase [Coriobacteriales bacterium]|jgi:aminopeptidase|nr:aminopeptidase [Coriobacteriales bacterium]